MPGTVLVAGNARIKKSRAAAIKKAKSKTLCGRREGEVRAFQVDRVTSDRAARKQSRASLCEVKVVQ